MGSTSACGQPATRKLNEAAQLNTAQAKERLMATAITKDAVRRQTAPSSTSTPESARLCISHAE